MGSIKWVIIYKCKNSMNTNICSNVQYKCSINAQLNYFRVYCTVKSVLHS